MLRALLCLCLLGWNVQSALAQPLDNSPVQWASRLIKYSTQLDLKSFSAAQVLGKPNAYPTYGKSLVAWRPAAGKRSKEYVQVAFDRPVSSVQQVAIAETYEVGAITRVILIDVNGNEYVVFNNPTPKGDRVPEAYMNRIFISPTGYKVAQLRLELNTAPFPDNPQIDAIGISTSRTPIDASINLAKYAKPVGKPQNLGAVINSEYDDMLPIISPDGGTLYFARKKSQENIGPAKNDDIYVSTRDVMGHWGNVVHPGPPLNDDNHNFVCTVSPDGNTLILANSYANGGGDGASISYKRKGEWTKPQTLPIKNMYNKSAFACYHMGVDGKTLVMAVERDDTYGDMDLYVSFQYADASWTEPMNLGPIVNTAAAEASIFLAADGKTIYFSSVGHPGYGEFDMYMSRRLDNTWRNWTEPINLGYPFNSPLSDYYYTIPASGEYAYFSSNDNSYGRSDLFRIPLPPEVRPEPVTMLKATVVASAPPQKVPGNTPAPVQPKPAEQVPVTLVMPRDNPEALYKNFQGFYPVEKSAATAPQQKQEEDNAPNAKAVKPDPGQAQLDQLQQKLQQLKKEQADIQVQLEQQQGKIYGVPTPAPATTPVPQVPAPTPQNTSTPIITVPVSDLSSLDAKLADLRSQMENLKNNPAPKNTVVAKTTPPASSYPNPVSQPVAMPGPSMEVAPYQQKLDQYQQSYNQPTNQEPQRIYYVPEKTVAKPYEEPVAPDKYTSYNTKLEELKAQRDQGVMQPQAVKTSKIKVDTANPAIKYQPKVQEAAQKPQADNAALKSFEEKLQKLREGMQAYENTPSPEAKVPAPAVQAPPPAVVTQEEKPAAVVQQPVPATAVAESIPLRQEEDIAALAEEKSSLAKENEALEESNRQLAEEKDQLVAQRQQLDSLIVAMEKERLSLAEEKKKMQEERDRLQQQKDLQSKEVAMLEKQIDQLAQSKIKTQAELQKAKQEVQQYEEKQEDIILMPLEKGAVIQVNNIYFNANATFLKPDSYKELNKIAAFLKSNPNIKVEIGGHTNGLCDDDFCLYLSDGRAKSVREYLLTKGIASDRVSSKGYGKQFPIADNATADGRIRNQRVEMKIIEVN